MKNPWSCRGALAGSPVWLIALILLCVAMVPRVVAEDVPLGPLGGSGALVPGTGLIRVTSLSPGGPGALAGLQVGDHVRGADGTDFGATSTNTNDGYVGALQDLAMAVDRAEDGSGTLLLHVVRSGSGGLDIPVVVGTAGSLGPAWPAGSTKADAIYEWCVAEIHAQVQSSSDGNFGYNSGWYGMILLSHPDWNRTSGATPYRNSINKLRTRCENYLNGRVLEPAERYYWNGSDVVENPAYQDAGLENWDVCSSAMFLALYRVKSGDTTADAIVQRAAEMIAHRIQSWNQYDDPGEPHVLGGGIGRMGHGGVHGDYSHYNGTGALNIINAHALPALALLRDAGANMNLNLGQSINSFSYDTAQLTPTIEEKFRICWDWVKQATNTSGGGDDGNVGYVGAQSGWDSAGRTGGCFAGWHLYGMTANADDTDKQARQAAYVARRWYRQQHAHAYTLGGVALSQLAMPFMDDRQERFFQENTRMFPALARQPDGSVAYFPGRQNNGGDSYLNKSRVALINAAMPGAVRSGNLPGFPAPDAGRIHAWMRSPANSWPALEAREVRLTGSLSHTLDVDVTDVDGNVLAPATYTATWAHVSGPGTTAFGSPNNADTTVTFPQDGTYRVELELSRNGYTLVEPYDLVVDTSTPPAAVAPYVVSQPVSQSAGQGESVSFTVDAQGTEPILYQWRLNGVEVGEASTSPSYTIDNVSAGSNGDYDCVITNSHGSTTSAVATLSVDGVGGFAWGGLWRDVFTGIGGSSVSDLTSAANFPGFPDASGVITNAESPSNYGGDYGQRWSGWITPPETGSYRFYVATDDNAELWISSDATRANRALVAVESNWRGVRSWPNSVSDESVSAPIGLVAGQRYFMELLHKEGGGGDNAAVTWDWQSPGVWATPVVGSAPLPGAILEYQVGGTLNDTITPPANYAPVASDQALVIYGGAATAVTLMGEDFETAPGALSFAVAQNPSQGVLGGTAPNVTYTPNPGASGTDTFTFTVNDGSQDSQAGTVTITLIPESGADLKVWDGSSSALWTTGGNWLGNAVPDANDAVIFNDDSIANLATSLNGNRSIQRLVVEDPVGAVTISDNTLTIDDGIAMLQALEDLTIASNVVIGAAQEWSVGVDRTLIASGDMAGSAALTKSGPGMLSLRSVDSRSGALIVDEGTVELNGGGWYAGYVGGSGMITVNGGGAVVNVVAHAFGSSNNPGRDLTLDGGRFRLQQETYIDDVWLTAGTVDNMPGANGELRSRSGGGSVVTVHAAAEPSVMAADYNFVGSATFDVVDGAADPDLLVSGSFAGGGACTKNGAGRMTLSGVSIHTGTLTVAEGSVAVTGSLGPVCTVTVRGVLEGTGNVQGSVSNDGIVAPGMDGAAVLTLGSFSQEVSAVTAVEIGGTTAGSEHDQLVVTGAASLAGILDVTLVNGFIPEIGDEVLLLTCGSRAGVFDTVNLPVLPEGRVWEVNYDPTGSPGLQLAVVGTPYVQWNMLEFGPDAGNPAIAGELSDPDGDLIVNVLEYALNLDPNVREGNSGPPGYEGLPVGDSGAGDYALIYRRNLGATDVSFEVQESDDLGNNDGWSPASVTETILSDDGQTQVVRAAVPMGTGDSFFLRLAVTK